MPARGNQSKQRVALRRSCAARQFVDACARGMTAFRRVEDEVIAPRRGATADSGVRVEIVLAQLLDERRATQFEESRRVRDRAVGLIERAADELLLDIAEVLA